jgi:hypothetical protein
VPLVFKHFWVMFIAVTFANGAIWWRRSAKHRANNPQLSDGYRSVILGFVTWGNLPWVIMGAGILIGGVPSIFHFFDPRSGNAFVLAWFGSIIILWVLGTYWLFLRGGAELLASLPGLLQPPLTSPQAVKALWLIAVAGGIAAFVAMFSGAIPVPEFIEPAA